jgi:hypothetical protein
MSDMPGARPPSSDPLADLRDDAQAAAAKLRDGAGQAADSLKGTVSGAADEAVTQGESIVDAARGRAEGLAEEGKEAVAGQASGFATAIRHAADDLEGTSPEIARHVRTAAESVEGISSALRDRSAGQLVQDVADFARRQPAAFFGVAAIAGFALARFAKSSSDGLPAGSGHAAGGAGPNQAPGWVPAGGAGSARPATMAAASLGGAVAHRAGEGAPGSMPVSSTSAAAPVGPAVAPGPMGGASGGSSPAPTDRGGTPL